MCGSSRKRSCATVWGCSGESLEGRQPLRLSKSWASAKSVGRAAQGVGDWKPWLTLQNPLESTTQMEESKDHRRAKATPDGGDATTSNLAALQKPLSLYLVNGDRAAHFIGRNEEVFPVG
jgi:hypothetical protein